MRRILIIQKNRKIVSIICSWGIIFSIFGSFKPHSSDLFHDIHYNIFHRVSRQNQIHSLRHLVLEMSCALVVDIVVVVVVNCVCVYVCIFFKSLVCEHPYFHTASSHNAFYKKVFSKYLLKIDIADLWIIINNW